MLFLSVYGHFRIITCNTNQSVITYNRIKMIQYVPGKIDLAGILIDILSKNVIIKLSDTVDALYLVFLQLRKARIEIITFWLMQKRMRGRLFSLSFFLPFRRYRRRRLYLRVLPDLLPEACRIYHPGSGHSWRQTWTGMTRFCSVF